ncbi:MAG TPA: hypothetical protein VKU41_14820 [Polyangiaceae bacterium]|nr:hypothetical protein [Polyangiaceae bacterium]
MSDRAMLEGNGAALVRERALAVRVQAALERAYGLDRVADVGEYMSGADDGGREALLVREARDGTVEVRLQVPRLEGEPKLDVLCQIIEGVSHFVVVVDRASTGRETTCLELELQAEVDKWLVIAASMAAFDTERSAFLRERLYERVVYPDGAHTEVGERYRVANDVAHRFVRRLENDYVRAGRYADLRAALRRFFHGGQEEKLRLGRVA